MDKYIKKLIMARKPLYFYWDDILYGFINYYRAIFKDKNGKLYLFRCFFSDTNIAQKPINLFTNSTKDFNKLNLESIGYLHSIPNFDEGKLLYQLTSEKLDSLQQHLENYIYTELYSILNSLSDEIKVELKIHWKPVMLVSCNLIVEEQLVGVIIILKHTIIPLSGDIQYISKVFAHLYNFQNNFFNKNLLIGDVQYGT